MNYLLLCLSFLFVTQISDPKPRTININTTAEVEIPADLIQFNITINAQADSPQEAYQMHQQKEDVLVQLLTKYDITEEDIRFEPISIHENRDRNPSNNSIETYYSTRQSVNVTFSNFDIYEEMQIALIEEGYDQFSGNFTSTQTKEGKDEALRKAIQKARDKAQLIADEAGVALGAILHITHSARPVQPYVPRMAVAEKSLDSLLQYEQTVVIRATIAMKFEITG